MAENRVSLALLGNTNLEGGLIPLLFVLLCDWFFLIVGSCSLLRGGGATPRLWPSVLVRQHAWAILL